MWRGGGTGERCTRIDAPACTGSCSALASQNAFTPTISGTVDISLLWIIVCVHFGISRADLALAPSWPNARRGRGRPLGSKGVKKVRIRTPSPSSLRFSLPPTPPRARARARSLSHSLYTNVFLTHVSHWLSLALFLCVCLCRSLPLSLALCISLHFSVGLSICPSSSPSPAFSVYSRSAVSPSSLRNRPLASPCTKKKSPRKKSPRKKKSPKKKSPKKKSPGQKVLKASCPRKKGIFPKSL